MVLEYTATVYDVYIKFRLESVFDSHQYYDFDEHDPQAIRLINRIIQDYIKTGAVE